MYGAFLSGSSHFIVEPPIWFTGKTPTTLTVNWDLESKLSDSEISQNGHVCECKTTGEVGDLIPEEDCRCFLVPLLSGKITFNFIDAASEKRRVVFFKLVEEGSYKTQRRFIHIVKLPE